MTDREGYFRRVQRLTPTRFWVNNPTESQAETAISAGAASCTTNPAYVSKLLANPGARRKALEQIAGALEKTVDAGQAAALAQRGAVVCLARLFMPQYLSSGGREGFVSLQGDPFAEDDTTSIVREAAEARRLSPNIIAKIPATKAGLKAADSLVREGMPVIITEIMSMSQARAACETWLDASAASGKRPPVFITSITGILDQCLQR